QWVPTRDCLPDECERVIERGGGNPAGAWQRRRIILVQIEWVGRLELDPVAGQHHRGSDRMLHGPLAATGNAFRGEPDDDIAAMHRLLLDKALRGQSLRDFEYLHVAEPHAAPESITIDDKLLRTPSPLADTRKICVRHIHCLLPPPQASRSSALILPAL